MDGLGWSDQAWAGLVQAFVKELGDGQSNHQVSKSQTFA